MLVDAAEESLAQAEFSLGRCVWNLAIRRCQECVELGLSGLLALVGVHYPKDHDQAPLLIQVLCEEGMPVEKVSAQELQRISADLSRKRGPALHQEEGYDESAGNPADDRDEDSSSGYLGS